MTDFAQPIAALVAAIGVLFKINDLRRDPGNPALRAICLVLASLSGAVLVGWTPCYAALDAVTGVPNLAKLCENALALTAAAAVQVLYLNLSDPDTARPRARRRWYLLALVIAVMAATFWAADFDSEAPKTFTDQYADDSHILPYMLVYLGYLALAMTDILRTSIRYARHAPQRLLRIGIHLLSVGSLIGLMYIIHKAAFIVAHRLRVVPPWSESSGSRVLIASGILLVTAGLVVPSVGTRVEGALQWLNRRRRYSQLHPLWLALAEAMPEIVLYRTQNPSRDPLIPRNLRHALYRRVIEIHDGFLRLQPHADSDEIALVREWVTTTRLDQQTATDPDRAAAELALVAANFAHSPVFAGMRSKRPTGEVGAATRKQP